MSYGRAGVVSGFDHAALDTLQTEQTKSQAQLYPYPLWMYRHRRLSDPFEPFTMQFSAEPAPSSRRTPVATTRYRIPRWVPNQAAVVD